MLTIGYQLSDKTTRRIGGITTISELIYELEQTKEATTVIISQGKNEVIINQSTDALSDILIDRVEDLY